MFRLIIHWVLSAVAIMFVSRVVPGFYITGMVPAFMAALVIGFLNAKINASLADPGIKAKLVELGFVPTTMTPGEFSKLIADETARWAEVIGAAKIRPE